MRRASKDAHQIQTSDLVNAGVQAQARGLQFPRRFGLDSDTRGITS